MATPLLSSLTSTFLFISASLKNLRKNKEVVPTSGKRAYRGGPVICWALAYDTRCGVGKHLGSLCPSESHPSGNDYSRFYSLQHLGFPQDCFPREEFFCFGCPGLPLLCMQLAKLSSEWWVIIRSFEYFGLAYGSAVCQSAQFR